MMHAIIEPSVLIWDKDELIEGLENDDIKNKYSNLSSDIISLIAILQKDWKDYLNHKIYLRPELVILLNDQIPFSDIHDIYGEMFDLQSKVLTFLANSSFEDYTFNNSHIEMIPNFHLNYYSSEIKDELDSLYNFALNKLDQVAIFGSNNSSFFYSQNTTNFPEIISYITTNKTDSIKYYDTISKLDSYFDVQYNNKNYQGILRTGQIMVSGIECIEKYFNRLKRKFNESPKHKPPHGWGTHLFISKDEADELLQNAIWNIEHPDSRFLYGILNLFGKNIIHAFPEENIVAENSYHGYPICDKDTYTYLQEKYREANPSYPIRSTWQNADIPNYVRRELL
jgi:hypothetical protein